MYLYNKLTKDQFTLNVQHHYSFIGFLSYYGHASNTSNLGNDMHLSFIFAAIVEIPAFSVPFIINYNGRRWTLFTAFLVAGASSMFYALIPPGMSLDIQNLKIKKSLLFKNVVLKR